MKHITTALLLSFSLTAFGQFNSDLIGLERRGDTYVINDTILSGTDTLIQTRIVNAEKFLAQYFLEVESNLQQIAMSMSDAIKGQEKVAKQQSELQKLGLLSQYIQYIDAQRTITGTFRVSYNNTNTTLNAGQDEHLYTQGGVKVVNVLEIASNWIRCTLVTMGNEVIDVYEIRPGLWAGQGNNGLLIIQR